VNSGPLSWWATPPALFLWRVFQNKVSQNYLLGLALNHNPDLCLLSARIIGVSYWHLAILLLLFFFMWVMDSSFSVFPSKMHNKDLVGHMPYLDVILRLLITTVYLGTRGRYHVLKQNIYPKVTDFVLNLHCWVSWVILVFRRN
jgi:hypothetical protein